MTIRRGSEEAAPTRDEALQPPDSQYGSGDQVETIERNPKSWAAWKREAERLQREVEYLTNAGVIECAVRNRSVSEYMNHWEDRTLKAESQLTALRQERAWQPIETAPKNSKAILVWEPENQNIWQISIDPQGRRSSWCSRDCQFDRAVTHWMPLPSSPTGTGEAG